MKKLIAIVITFIFIFDGAGYCLRPELYFGKSAGYIDKRSLAVIFSANDFLSWLFHNLVTAWYWRDENEAEDLNQRLNKSRAKYKEWRKLIRKSVSDFSSEQMARHYSEIVLFLKEIIPEIESIRNSCKGDRNRKLMSRYIADAKNIVAGLELLLDNSYKEIDINELLRKIHALIFSERYWVMNPKVDFRFSMERATIYGQQDKIAYLFFYLLYPFRGKIGKSTLDIKTDIEQKRGKPFILIRFYGSEADVSIDEKMTMITSETGSPARDVNIKGLIIRLPGRTSYTTKTLDFGHQRASKLISELGGEIDLIQDSGKIRGFKVLLPLPEVRGAIPNYENMLLEKFGYEWPQKTTKPQLVSAKELYKRLCDLRNRTGLTEQTRFNRFSGRIIEELKKGKEEVTAFLHRFQIASNGLERLGINTKDRGDLFNRFYRDLLQTSDSISTLMELKSRLEANFSEDGDKKQAMRIFQSHLLPYVINNEKGDLKGTAVKFSIMINFISKVKTKDRLKFLQKLAGYNFYESRDELFLKCLQAVHHIATRIKSRKSLSDLGGEDDRMATMRALLHINRGSVKSGLESFQKTLDSLNDDLHNKVSTCIGLRLVYAGITPWDRYFFTDLLNSLDKTEKEKLIRAILKNGNFIIIKEIGDSYSIINISAAYKVIDDNQELFPKRSWQTSDNIFRSWLFKNIRGCLGTNQRRGLLRGFYIDVVTQNPHFDFNRVSPLEPPVELGLLAETWAKEIERICGSENTSLLKRASVEAVSRQPQAQCL